MKGTELFLWAFSKACYTSWQRLKGSWPQQLKVYFCDSWVTFSIESIQKNHFYYKLNSLVDASEKIPKQDNFQQTLIIF